MLYRFERSSHFRITDEGSMSLSQVHYLPLTPPFFFILVGLFVAILVLIQLGVLRYAYMRLGISSGAALLLLFASQLNIGAAARLHRRQPWHADRCGSAQSRSH